MQLNFKGGIDESFIQIQPYGLQSHELRWYWSELADSTIPDVHKNGSGKTMDINKPHETTRHDGKFSQKPKKPISM